MKVVEIPKKNNSKVTFFVRVAQENRSWLKQQAEENGYARESEFFDVLVTSLREASNTGGIVAKKTKATKKTTKKSGKKY